MRSSLSVPSVRMTGVRRAASPWQALAAAVRLAATWGERRRQRRHLLALDDAALKDIGVSRADAVHEADKPFWRD